MTKFTEEDLNFKYENLQEGDNCVVDFKDAGIIQNCIIENKIQSQGVTMYNIRVYPSGDTLDYVQLKNIRSLYISKQ